MAAACSPSTARFVPCLTLVTETLYVQADHQLALLQHGTQLYLVNMSAVTRDLFYQLLLTRWEGAAVMQLGQPLHVGTLMELALKKEEAAGKWQVGLLN